jgi:hypothetical protein
MVVLGCVPYPNLHAYVKCGFKPPPNLPLEKGEGPTPYFNDEVQFPLHF